MTDTVEPTPTPQSDQSHETSLAAVVYALFIAGLFLGFIPGLIGVIIAHCAASTKNALLNSHFAYQIRTFWIGFAIAALSFVAISFAVAGMVGQSFKAISDTDATVTTWETTDGSVVSEHALADVQLGNGSFKLKIDATETDNGARVSIQVNDGSLEINDNGLTIDSGAQDSTMDAAAIAQQVEDDMNADSSAKSIVMNTNQQATVRINTGDKNVEITEDRAVAFFQKVAPPMGLGIVGFVIAFLFVLVRSITGLVRLARKEAM